MTAIAIDERLHDVPKLLKKRQRHSRWFVVLALVVMIFTEGSMAIFYHNWYEVMEATATILIAVCVLGRSYSSAYIGGVKNDVVMQTGPFSIVRNPLYVFSYIGLLGISLYSGMMSMLVLLTVSFFGYYYFVVSREEAFLLNKFGDEYRAYKKRVPRWIPKFSLWDEPSEIIIKPRFLRRTMRDALVFFLPFPCFEILNILHENGTLPVLFILP